jgi:hypothetical protein
VSVFENNHCNEEEEEEARYGQETVVSCWYTGWYMIRFYEDKDYDCSSPLDVNILTTTTRTTTTTLIIYICLTAPDNKYCHSGCYSGLNLPVWTCCGKSYLKE